MIDFVIKHAIFFFNRYRTRITIAAILAIAASVYYAFFYQPAIAADKKQSRRLDGNYNTFGRKIELVEMQSLTTNPQAGLKARLLLRIRKQFDLSIRIFLPTLRKAVFDLIDISQPVRQIKALRANNVSSLHQMDTEAQLWEEVKISSFTMLFVSTDVLCGLTTVLKVQLHVLARSILRGEGPALESLGATPDNAEEAAIYARDSALLRKLIDGTFRFMFGPGLQRIADLIRGRLQNLLRDWVVRERMKVEFEDILVLINSIRRDFESDFDPLIRSLLYDDKFSTKSPFNSEKSSSGQGSTKITKEDPRAERLLRQIRQAIDNPMFSVVYRESLDSAFRMVVDNLRRFVFLSGESLSPSSTPSTPGMSTPSKLPPPSSVNGLNSTEFTTPKRQNSNSLNGFHSPNVYANNHHSNNYSSPIPGAAGMARRASQTSASAASPPPLNRTPSSSSSMPIMKKTPPLASILPQLKSLSGRLLPETAETVNPYDLKSLTSGPLLESFCMTIFDAEDMVRVI